MIPVVLSPYELHARSVCASAALLLGEPAVTLLPAPLEGTEPGEVGRAMLESPGFGRLLERWRWSSALWHSGALCGALNGVEPLELVRRAAAGIVAAGDAAENGRGSLATLIRETRFEETAHYLEAISRDLERGGGDPSVSVPVSVGMEAYAGSVGGVMAMGAGKSLVGRLEARRERVIGRLTTTLVHGAAGVLLEELREALDEELIALRAAVWEAMCGRSMPSDGVLDEAAGRLERAVNGLPDGMLGPRDQDEERIRGGVRRVAVSVTLASVPMGDALRAASRAAEMLAAGRGSRSGRSRRVSAATRRGANGATHGTQRSGDAGGTALTAGSVIRMRVRELPFNARVTGPCSGGL